MCDKEVCYKTSNNKYFDCPPRMDDGRHFTDYRNNCYVNNLVRNNKNITNSFQYRMFLTRNANKIMDLNKKYTCQKNCCGDCQNMDVSNDQQGKKNKYSDQTLSCPGFNISKGINNSCTPNNDNFNYYPFNKKKNVRLSIPGGGIPLQGGDPNTYQ